MEGVGRNFFLILMIVKENILCVCKILCVVNFLEDVVCLIGGNVGFFYFVSFFGLGLKV